MPDELPASEETLVKAIEKGPDDQIHVRVSRFRERDYVDIRHFYPTEEGEWKPTRKGIAIPVDLYPDLLAALKEAEPVIAARRKEKPATPKA